MNIPVIEIDSPGLGISIQDRGRIGWRRFGVPPSGCMDEHAALWANRLLDNPADAALLELQFQGAELAFLQNAWIALTGADLGCNVPLWRAVHVSEGDVVRFPQNRVGLWCYMAIEGGFASESIFGSKSAYPRGQLGGSLRASDLLARTTLHCFSLPAGVSGRTVPWSEHRDYSKPAPLRVWPGPQWNSFAPAQHDCFFATDWRVTSQSDRAGYRLSGPALEPKPPEIVSEPVRVGSVQVPENGQPIVTMRDGPTVGGYPKIGWIDARDLSWLAQCRPGQKVRFQLAE